MHRLAPILLLLLTAALTAPACQRFTKEGADEEVYGLLGARRAEVEQLQGTLDIESRERLAHALRDRTTFQITLRDALELGTVGSRDYRRQREVVYLAALDLTRALNEFNPLWNADGSVDYRVDEDGSQIDADFGVTLRRAFQRGGGLVVSLTNSFLRDLTGNPLRTAQSVLTADVVLPLLRGSGELVARENLTQAERNVLYSLRSYARFQQEFTVDIATRFYRALQSRDGWKNAESRYDNLKLLVAEQSEKANAGRLPKFQVDQVEQDLLESDDARQRARNQYETSVDRLKLDLGIPVGVDVKLDDSDLDALRKAGPQAVEQTRAEGLRLAALRRLDLRSEFDREVDARRRVLVSRDALRAGIDLRVGGDLRTPGEQPLDFGSADASGNLGLDIDLPLERTNERNAYRRALIDAGRAKRDRERFEDTVAFEVRDAYRTLAQAARSYEIQEVSLKLAERRVESTQLLLELGTAQTRDRLEAEDALVRARNALTASLVDHALARLGLERDVGILRVDAQGMWHAVPKDGTAPSSAETAGTPTPRAVVQPTVDAGLPAPLVRGAGRPVSRNGRASGAAQAPARAMTSPPPAVLAPARKIPAVKIPPRIARPRTADDGNLPPPQVIPRRSGTVGPAAEGNSTGSSNTGSSNSGR